MISENPIPPPILFNLLKHHLGFIKEYVRNNLKPELQIDYLIINKDLRHLGGSLMDIYSGNLSPDDIMEEIMNFLISNGLAEKDIFSQWTGKDPLNFKTISFSDGSRWILKFFDNEVRYVHSFPARNSPYTFRIKANTLKSAILYLIFVGKDFISEEDLNSARAIAGLSPIKDIYDVEAITEMIEILRR
jgi:hypothetical protein